MMPNMGHFVGSKARTSDGYEINCSCGESFSGQHRTMVDAAFRQHCDDSRVASRAYYREHLTGPETAGKRAADDGLPRPLHVMARERGA